MISTHARRLGGRLICPTATVYASRSASSKSIKPSAIPAFLAQNQSAGTRIPHLSSTILVTRLRRQTPRCTYDHTPLFYDMGDKAALKKLFPDGLAGGEHLRETFKQFRVNAVLVRPLGVALVQVRSHIVQ